MALKEGSCRQQCQEERCSSPRHQNLHQKWEQDQVPQDQDEEETEEKEEQEQKEEQEWEKKKEEQAQEEDDETEQQQLQVKPWKQPQQPCRLADRVTRSL